MKLVDLVRTAAVHLYTVYMVVRPDPTLVEIEFVQDPKAFAATVRGATEVFHETSADNADIENHITALCRGAGLKSVDATTPLHVAAERLSATLSSDESSLAMGALANPVTMDKVVSVFREAMDGSPIAYAAEQLIHSLMFVSRVEQRICKHLQDPNLVGPDGPVKTLDTTPNEVLWVAARVFYTWMAAVADGYPGVRVSPVVQKLIGVVSEQYNAACLAQGHDTTEHGFFAYCTRHYYALLDILDHAGVTGQAFVDESKKHFSRQNYNLITEFLTSTPQAPDLMLQAFRQRTDHTPLLDRVEASRDALAWQGTVLRDMATMVTEIACAQNEKGAVQEPGTVSGEAAAAEAGVEE